jgi:hypothetical protein
MKLTALLLAAATGLAQAGALSATDPAIASGEMIAEYHADYGSAALELVNEAHSRIRKKSF